MKPSHELFSLIHSLTKSEKRFFKLSSSLQMGEKNYSKLFDYIDGEEVYDEAKLKKHFQGERFIKHLSSEKNHLYKLILKSLRNFQGEHLVKGQLQQELRNVRILYEKALYKEAGKFLKRAKKIAHKNEAFYILTDFISWEKILIEESYQAGNFDVDIDEIVREEAEVIKKLNNLADYHILYSRINAVFRSNFFVNNERQRKVVDEISNHPLIKGKNTALSVRATTICYYIQGLCALVNRELEVSQKKFEYVRELFDKHLEIRRDLPQRYIQTLFNLIQCHSYNRHFEGALEIFNYIKEIDGKKEFNSIQLGIRINKILFIERIRVFNLKGQFNKALNVYKKQSGRSKYLLERSNKQSKIEFYFYIGYTHFALGNYKLALNFINYILNDNEKMLRQDIYSYARILNLMIHIELGNFEYIDHLSLSTLRYLKRVERDATIESVFIKELKKLSKKEEESVRKNQFKVLNKRINVAIIKTSPPIILEYINILAWIEAKGKGELFSELILKESSDEK